MPEPTRPKIDVEEFVGLLMGSQQRVFSYILTLLPNVADAQDVLQETSIVLWRRLAEYEPGTDFTAWASGWHLTWCGTSAPSGTAAA